MAYGRYKQNKPLPPCYDKALDLLARRAHSRAELEHKLRERGYAEDELQDTLERLCAAHLIDDAAYAEHMAERLARTKGFAPRRIALELRRRGVGDEELSAALEPLETQDARESIRAMLEKKFARDLDSEKGRRRAVNALVRMGYSWGDIRSAMREYDSTEENYYD
ncbi:MAG: recombination regulator RecX [Clostridium sp.]|jgi:regulatory protein|nr:recombination regulator RecX [Clostridium sp.]